MKALRVLIVGSKSWWDRDRVYDFMMNVSLEHRDEFGEFILVTGAAPVGVDKIAVEIAEEVDWTIERYPADWVQYKHRADYVRDIVMVGMGADICGAFVTEHTKKVDIRARDLAEKAKIPTKTYWE